MDSALGGHGFLRSVNRKGLAHGVIRLAFAGSQPDRAFPETDGYSRSPKDTQARSSEFRRAIATVRDREAWRLDEPGPASRASSLCVPLAVYGALPALSSCCR
jgi:hypothetical protein